MQGGAVVPQRPAQVRCDPQGRPSLRDAEPRSQRVSGGEEVLRVPWGGGGLPIGSELSHPHTGSQQDGPLMVDLMCGPNMPLAKAFRLEGAAHRLVAGFGAGPVQPVEAASAGGTHALSSLHSSSPGLLHEIQGQRDP